MLHYIFILFDFFSKMNSRFQQKPSVIELLLLFILKRESITFSFYLTQYCALTLIDIF